MCLRHSALALVALLVCLASACAEPDEPAAEPTATLDPEGLEELRALGYVEVAPALSEVEEAGVRVFDRSRARPGLNLFTDAKACATHLIDMEGTVLHSWVGRPCFRWDNSLLLANGDLLAVVRKARGRIPAEADAARRLVRLTWEGETRWERALTVHHDVDVTPDGHILAMTHRLRKIPSIHPTVPVRDHLLVRLSGAGLVLEERSLWDLLQASPGLLSVQRRRPRDFEGATEVDLFHGNSVEWMRQPNLRGTSPLYGANTVLVCIRNQDAFVIFDWKKGRVLWAWGANEMSAPHDATLLPNGHVLGFDNGMGRGWSRVIEVDPRTDEIVWEYRSPNPSDFYSQTRGAAQRLTRDHTLVTESQTGRAFEITPGGEIVWEFVNPALSEEREPGVIVRIRRLEGLDFPTLVQRLESGEPLPLAD